ncbi:alpha-1,2-fucosyltransferase, partial [Enterococcus faecium]
MIVLTLGGGLGNQMFQYGYARYIQKIHREKFIYINDSEVIKEADRFNSLGNLNTVNIKVLPRIISKPLNETERLVRKIMVRLFGVAGFNESAIFQSLNKFGIYYHPSVYKFYESLKTGFPIKIIEGGFQSWKYLETCPEIKQELRVKYEPMGENLRLLNLISQSESVCVHIRRGDYLSPKYKHLNVCDYQYYFESMNYIISKLNNPTFFIFSNT